jgi:hypothetical protein
LVEEGGASATLMSLICGMAYTQRDKKETLRIYRGCKKKGVRLLAGAGLQRAEIVLQFAARNLANRTY